MDTVLVSSPEAFASSARATARTSAERASSDASSARRMSDSTESLPMTGRLSTTESMTLPVLFFTLTAATPTLSPASDAAPDTLSTAGFAGS